MLITLPASSLLKVPPSLLALAHPVVVARDAAALHYLRRGFALASPIKSH